MASAGYRAWVAAGKPWTLAGPLLQLQRTIQGYGYTVYSYPDEAHQQANTPEDHTSYSATGWPVASPRWWAFAIDIMPKKSGGMADLTRMARQIIADKDAGYPGTEWIKYINWTDEGGKTWHTSWQPNKATKTSTDKGHTHISGRSDRTQATTPYDPIARLSGGGTGRSDEDMAILAEGPKGELFFCIGGFSHPILATNIADIKYVASQGAYSLAHNAKGNVNDAEWTGDGWVRKGWSANVFGPIWYGDIDPTQPHGWALATRVEALSKLLDKTQTGETSAVSVLLKALGKIDVAALAAALAPLLNAEIGSAAVVEALESDAGQAALVKANETSEDS